MGKLKNQYISLQQQLQEKALTSTDPNHWSYCVDLLNDVIDAEYGDMAEKRKIHLKLNN